MKLRAKVPCTYFWTCWGEGRIRVAGEGEECGQAGSRNEESRTCLQQKQADLLLHLPF
jgi:hypothetical protein